MSKLHRTESLESLISNGPTPSDLKRRSPPKAWIWLTYINFIVLVATLIIAGSTLRLLTQLPVVPETNLSKSPKSASSSGSPRTFSSHRASKGTSDEDAAASGWLSCGNSTEQAIERGCIFDLMLTTWLHPDCYWHEHATSAFEAANLTYFLDEALTIPFHDAGSGDWPQQFLWTQPWGHTLHCSYMWERQIMAWTSGSVIDSECWDVKHTHHCVMAMLEPNKPYGYKSARLGRAFSSCGQP